MAYGNFIDNYYRQLGEINSLLSQMESNTVSIWNLSRSQCVLFDYHNIIWALGNMTVEECEDLYPYDDPESKLKEYENILDLFKHSLYRYLKCAYKEGEWNVISREYYYEDLDLIGPSIELLKLLPLNYELEYHTPEQLYKYSISEKEELHKRIYIFQSARAGYKPAVKLAKEAYGWEFEN